ncbi:MAG: Pycsar system effector family protein [Bacteroidota bacterium]
MAPDLVQQDNPLIIAARQRAAELSLQYQDPRQLLYTEQLGAYLEEKVQQFGQADQLPEATVQLAQLTALFYPIGIQLDPAAPAKAAQAAGADFLQEQQADLIAPLQNALEESFQKQGREAASKLVLDALVGIICDDEPHHWAQVRQLEQELKQGNTDRLAQAQMRLQELLNIRYHSTAGRAYWQEKVAQTVIAQKKKLEKLSRGLASVGEQKTAPFADLEPQLPVRGAQTYFRAVYRNHINLSAIADNKANIMISVNSILISVLITFLSYRNIAETQPAILLPVVIFLVTGISSLVFAVLSARPKVTNINAAQADKPSKGLAFFGNFVHLSSEVFEDAIDDMFHSSSLLYSNMVQDLYHLGKVLDQKYRYLSIAYNIFMVGLIVTVLLFLFTLFAF